MNGLKRTIVYDSQLQIEAYHFEGMDQPFPSHFHEYYVIGLMEHGQRILSCKNREYAIQPGDTLLFNPGDSHACVQSGGSLDYRGFNISKEVMLSLAELCRWGSSPTRRPSWAFPWENSCRRLWAPM